LTYFGEKCFDISTLISHFIPNQNPDDGIEIPMPKSKSKPKSGFDVEIQNFGKSNMEISTKLG
jgi:hypothetical protein